MVESLLCKNETLSSNSPKKDKNLKLSFKIEGGIKIFQDKP
jgi:hypothetical protein